MINIAKEISPFLILKGLLLAAVYFTLAIYFVFFVPREVPAIEMMETIRVSEGQLDLSYNKSANTSYFTGTYKDLEMRSITLSFQQGLKLYGTNEFFLQMKARPQYYELMLFRTSALFRDRYSIYQIADENEVLISYAESARVNQSERNKFFYLGLGFLAIMGFILIRTLVRKINEK